MLSTLFNNISEEDKNAAIENIVAHATPRQDYFLMLVLSVAMASFGLLLNSTVILVGSMLIAPLLYPLLSLALAIIVTDEKLIGLSFCTIGKSVLFGVGAGFVIGVLFSGGTSVAETINTAFSPMYAIVAAIAGFAAAFAITKPHLNEMLPGVAISVSLVPPLSGIGLAIATFDWVAASNALLLFTVNVIGIVFSAMIVFSLMRFSVKKTVTKEVVKEKEKVIKQEAALAEKNVEAAEAAHA